MPDTVIDQVNALVQSQPNNLEWLDIKKCPIRDIEVTGLDDRETETPYIELLEPGTDLDPIPSRSEILTDLVEQQDISTT